MARFVMECRRRNLPLNVGKEVMQDFCATILGGELDGVAGTLMHARDKGSRLANRTLAILFLRKRPAGDNTALGGHLLFYGDVPSAAFCSRAGRLYIYLQIFRLTQRCPVYSGGGS